MTTPLQLPEPRDVPLRRSPLTLVVCQVRHDPVLGVADARSGIDVQARLEGLYPEIAPHHAMSMEVTIAGGGSQVSQDRASGWQMRSEDAAWTLTILPDAFSIETSAYLGWPDFLGRLSTLVSAVAAVYGPALEQRVGLRFIDEIDDPQITSPQQWKGWIRDELLGPLAHSGFGPAVRGTQQILELDAGSGYRVTLRHGTSPVASGHRWIYLLDQDCFRQAGRSFSEDGVLTAATELHRVALQVFQSAITDALYAHLDPKEDSA